MAKMKQKHVSAVSPPAITPSAAAQADLEDDAEVLPSKSRQETGMMGYLASVESGTLTGRPPHEEVIWVARAEDISRRILLGRTVPQVAREIGMTSVNVRNIMARPEFMPVFERIRTSMYKPIDETIADERADVLLRKDALYSRAMTMAGEIMDAVRQHIKDAPVPRAAMLKAGVDALAQVRMLKDAAAPVQAAASHFHLNVSADKAAVIQATLAESGVDLSDILDDFARPVVDVEGEVVPS